MPGWSNDDLSQFWPLFIRNCRGLMRPTSGNRPRRPRHAARRQPVCAPRPIRARRRATARRAPLPANLSATLAAECRRRQAGHEHRHRLLRAAGARFAAAGRRLSMAAVHRAGGPADHRPGVGVSGTGRQARARQARRQARRALRHPRRHRGLGPPSARAGVGGRSGGQLLSAGAGFGPRAADRRPRFGQDHPRGLRRSQRPALRVHWPLADRPGRTVGRPASMQNIRAWAQRNPKRVPEMLNANPAVVFFREEAVVDPEQGPKGAYGIALAPQRSVAVDAGFVPLGTPVFWPPRIPRPTGRCSGWCSPRTPAPPSAERRGPTSIGATARKPGSRRAA